VWWGACVCVCVCVCVIKGGVATEKASSDAVVMRLAAATQTALERVERRH